jgi:glycosyltransferase involved in cell wall biosynthesis
MKIVFDGQTFINQTHGGISRYVTSLADELARIGEETFIVAPLYRNAHLESCTAARVHGRKYSPPPATVPIAKIASRILSRRIISRINPDVLHETYYSPVSVAPRGVRTILTVYDMIHEIHPQGLGRLNQTARFKRAAVRRADKIICISENTRRDLVQLLDVPREKTEVVLLAAERLPAKQGTRSPLPKPFLLYVGARPGYKNFAGLLHAVARSNALRQEVEVAAFGGGDFSRAEVELIHQLGMGARVHHFAGDDSTLGHLYEHAELLVYPSMYEGFGLPPLEAMIHGCPVACSATSSLPEVAGDAAEYFRPDEPESIARAIERILADSKHRDRLIAAGKIQSAKFSWNRCASETLEIYRRVVRA